MIKESKECLLDDKENRLLFGVIFYNPSDQISMDIAYELFNEIIPPSTISKLIELKNDNNHFINKKILNAGGIENFKKDVATIINYYLFKQACLKFAETNNSSDIINEYTKTLFASGISNYFCIKNESTLKEILHQTENKLILKDIFEFALGIKLDNYFTKRYDRKNIKQKTIEKYNFHCFFDIYNNNDIEQQKKAHELTYFKTKKKQTYLEAHHMIQMENSKFFQNDIDIIENLIPVCPNCHRKLHNADTAIVRNLIDIFYNHIDKNTLIKKGIFIDKDTLYKFYGIEEDSKESNS